MNKFFLTLPFLLSLIPLFLIGFKPSSNNFSTKTIEQNKLFFISAGIVTSELETLELYLDNYRQLGKETFWQSKVESCAAQINRDILLIQKESPEQIAKRINYFLALILENANSIATTSISSEEEEHLKIVKIKADSRKLKNIVKLAVEKRQKATKGSYIKNQAKEKKTGLIFALIFVALTLALTIAALILSHKLSKLSFSISSKKKTKTKELLAAIEQIKKSKNEEFYGLKKQFSREQIVSKRKEALLNTIPEAIFSADMSGKITFINQTTKDWFGIESVVIGENSDEIFKTIGIKPEESSCEKFNYNENIYQLFTTKNQDETFFIVRDISASEELSNKLLSSERLASIGEMASRITHEIRNPLNTLKLNSEYLAENAKKLKSSEISTSINLIVKEVERLEEITNKYIDMVHYRKHEESERLTNLPTDLLEFLSFHLPELEKREIELTTGSCAAFNLAITLSSFTEIMLNLLKNSWEELKHGGKIAINVTKKESWLAITVEDSGSGIPDEEKEMVFKNFYTKKAGGTGIGLSHSRKLATDAGGKLYVENSTTLGGACFV